jgi:hypothetical protein
MTIKTAHDGQLLLVEETLTDGSKVYNIEIHGVTGRQLATIECAHEVSAHSLFNVMSTEILYQFS